VTCKKIVGGYTASMKIIQAPQIETETVGDIMAVKIPKELLLWEVDWHFFLDLQQTKKLKIKSLDLKTLRTSKDLRHYIYYNGDVQNLLGAEGILASGEYTSFEKENINSIDLIKNPDFDPQKLMYLWSDAHLWYGFRGDIPLSPTYYIHYIGGVTNTNYDLNKAEAILKKDPRVSRLKLIEIPYYNQEENHTHALEFLVQLSQKDYDKVVRYYRDEKKVGFWSCRVRESLTSSHDLSFNTLKLKSALKEKCKT
jgi:hypothetical protein